MADEWSKPVKGPYGWSVDRGETKLGLFWDGDLVIRDDDYGSPTAPRDVVLRLLAAEASDRLGWVWEVRRDNDGKAKSASPGSWVEWRRDGHVTVESDFNSDELLACQHGRFLLADALREAGQ